MTRITNDHRQTIRKAVLAHRFTEPLQQLRVRYEQLALDIYNDVYSEKDRALMESLPKDWLVRSLNIRVKLGASSYEDFNFNGLDRGITSSEHIRITASAVSRPIFASDQHRCVAAYDARSDFATRHATLGGQATDLYNSITEAANIMNVVLDRANTPQQLLRAWPEVKPFIGFLEVDKPKLPALPITKLNSLLELPVDKAA